MLKKIKVYIKSYMCNKYFQFFEDISQFYMETGAPL